jgi:hypothetical protein
MDMSSNGAYMHINYFFGEIMLAAFSQNNTRQDGLVLLI